MVAITGVSTTPVLIMLLLMAVMDVSTATVGGFAVAVVHNRDVADAAWGWAIARTGAPAVGVYAACKDRRTIADRVESIQVGIVVAAAAVVVIAVGVGVVAPLGIAGADIDRARIAAAPAIITGAGPIGRTYRGEVGVVVAGGERGGCDDDRNDSTKTDVFDHASKTT